MSIPIFNVPNLPGVPPMIRSALTSVGNAEGLIASVGTVLQFLAGAPPLPTWGIYLSSTMTKVINADSIMSFTYKKMADIPTFQVQGGQLSAYNKVQFPYDASVRITKGGSQADRQSLIRQLDAVQASLENFTIVTPEKSYLNANVIGYDLTRKDQGDAYFFSDVEIYLKQVPTTTAVYTSITVTPTNNAVQASAQPPQNNGVLQSSAPSPMAQASALTTIQGLSP